MNQRAGPREEPYILFSMANFEQENDCACPNASTTFLPEPAPGVRFQQQADLFQTEIAPGVRVFFYPITNMAHLY